MNTNKGKMQIAEEKWLTRHGFTYELIKEKSAACVYDITKEDFTIRVELPKALSDCPAYMRIVADTWNMKKQIAEKEN